MATHFWIQILNSIRLQSQMEMGRCVCREVSFRPCLPQGSKCAGPQCSHNGSSLPAVLDGYPCSFSVPPLPSPSTSLWDLQKWILPTQPQWFHQEEVQSPCRGRLTAGGGQWCRWTWGRCFLGSQATNSWGQNEGKKVEARSFWWCPFRSVGEWYLRGSKGNQEHCILTVWACWGLGDQGWHGHGRP